MRNIGTEQLDFIITPIAEVEIDLDSRDEIPQLLLGLQHIYSDAQLYAQVLNLLVTLLPKDISVDHGRPGMDLWEILVLGVLRVNCDWDYD